MVGALLAAGYVARDVHQHWVTRLTSSLPPLEHYLWWDSYSEVQQTRAVLDALCLRAIAEARVDYLARRHGPAPLTMSSNAAVAVARAERLARLDALLEEFQGTDQVLRIQAERLRILERGGDADAWLNIYLALAYRHPTEPMVAILTGQARRMADATGRGAELARALEHRQTIPTEYWPRNGGPGESPAKPTLRAGLPFSRSGEPWD